MALGREKALTLFFAGSKKANLTVTRIEKWDPEKTLKENAGDIGIDYQSCVELAKSYHLEYKKVKNFRF